MRDKQLGGNIILQAVERYYGGDYIARGLIYSDPRQRFKDGSSIRTSSIETISFKKGYIETRNSLYRIISKEDLL